MGETCQAGSYSVQNLEEEEEEEDDDDDDKDEDEEEEEEGPADEVETDNSFNN
jgi:hypothetical protein